MDIIERDVGANIPISIGTSFALEGLIGTHPQKPRQPTDVKSIKEIWINVRTLARNMWQAMKSEQQTNINLVAAVDVLFQEAQTIPVALRQSGIKATVKYYITGRDAVKWLFPKATFKVSRTPQQLAYDVYERFVSIELYQKLKDTDLTTMEISNKPPKVEGTVLLLTHFPHELLWKPHFNRLLLLESHTGKIKTYNMWYTKLNGLKEDTPFPFTSFAIQIFGDKQLLEPQDKAIRAQLKQLAQSRKWTGLTTPDKVHHDITAYGSKELKEAYKKFK
ncbi:hypothetical protein KEN51_CDS0356 [Pseudomonas phage vB_Pae10145-KEN51]|uniref:Uncharacterized protein n=5 Tax=root TaxID=1 RepID=I7CDR8_9CAUD|nr:hypothetical protein FDI90_gp317 [Pseudomonas phage PA7]ANM44846.1 hypothetical protein KTN4_088 [Pseudomonas phage KTN4]MCT4994290.1 hypothetical protein [Pseudomonas aeruginosa]QJB22724.1 hypothetical protein fnug_81 [Pseudomonas phage fnug]QOV07938.1 hypothetical protein [Pseudomonas phage vB_PaeM_kmuB]USL86667.1 hypothetical protein CDGHABPJ_00209 [Pseudomonas phage OMKO1]WAX23612.1 hypothetical protein [Pseudomonas phage pPA-N1803-4At.2]WNV47752.1 hypothetical protein [Pseudomonas ph